MGMSISFLLARLMIALLVDLATSASAHFGSNRTVALPTRRAAGRKLFNHRSVQQFQPG
jgi:hypothetical protein